MTRWGNPKNMQSHTQQRQSRGTAQRGRLRGEGEGSLHVTMSATAASIVVDGRRCSGQRALSRNRCCCRCRCPCSANCDPTALGATHTRKHTHRHTHTDTCLRLLGAFSRLLRVQLLAMTLIRHRCLLRVQCQKLIKCSTEGRQRGAVRRG